MDVDSSLIQNHQDMETTKIFFYGLMTCPDYYSALKKHSFTHGIMKRREGTLNAHCEVEVAETNLKRLNTAFILIPTKQNGQKTIEKQMPLTTMTAEEEMAAVCASHTLPEAKQ